MSMPAARRILRRAIAHLPPALRRRLLFLRHHRKWLPLQNPVTFNEKVNWRLVYDRRDIIAITGDKERSKEYALSRGVKAPPVLWRGTDVDDFESTWTSSDELEWVLKPNFSSGDVIFGRGRPRAADLAASARIWLGSDRAAGTGEWVYGRADRTLLVEEKIGPPDSAITDYKFFVFAGTVVTVRAVNVTSKKTTGVRYYNPDGSDSAYTDPLLPLAAPGELPECWPDMVNAASRLGRDFDFIRVDLYGIGEEVWFGELTAYPGGGLHALDPKMDRELGRRWVLPSLDRRGRASTTPDEEVRAR